jgi:hypothetical protein
MISESLAYAAARRPSERAKRSSASGRLARSEAGAWDLGPAEPNAVPRSLCASAEPSSCRALRILCAAPPASRRNHPVASHDLPDRSRSRRITEAHTDADVARQGGVIARTTPQRRLLGSGGPCEGVRAVWAVRACQAPVVKTSPGMPIQAPLARRTPTMWSRHDRRICKRCGPRTGLRTRGAIPSRQDPPRTSRRRTLFHRGVTRLPAPTGKAGLGPHPTRGSLTLARRAVTRLCASRGEVAQ